MSGLRLMFHVESDVTGVQDSSKFGVYTHSVHSQGVITRFWFDLGGFMRILTDFSIDQ